MVPAALQDGSVSGVVDDSLGPIRTLARALDSARPRSSLTAVLATQRDAGDHAFLLPPAAKLGHVGPLSSPSEANLVVESAQEGKGEAHRPQTPSGRLPASNYPKVWAPFGGHRRGQSASTYHF